LILIESEDNGGKESDTRKNYEEEVINETMAVNEEDKKPDHEEEILLQPAQ
jgi:hypothetical protein